ncbi:MAG TPA: type II toxin-antitoxin system RelE/ParE family toxin [Thermoleophilia bacterium]|nr:type II toxin-antitoxin system RelE/ParE family toxin [Thermoleophilia bacterium]
MKKLRKTESFARWLDDLRDLRARARIQVRIERLAAGNPGDVKAVGKGVSELRIDYGPGYRVYFTRREGGVIVLLAGGIKSTQTADIENAQRLADGLREGHR